MTPGEKAKWRFTPEEYNKVNAESSQLLKQGWGYKQRKKDVILNFFSQNITGKLSLWRLTAALNGQIKSLKKLDLE